MSPSTFPLTHFFSPCKIVSFFIGISLSLMVSTAKAQVVNSGQILRAGTEDANILLQEYLKPFGGGFGADLNSGWIISAAPLNKFGFNIRVSASASYVPSKDRLFNVRQLDLNSVRLLRGPSNTPTAFGDDQETSTLGATIFNSSSEQQKELYSFKMPRGTGFHYVPAPMAQFSLGLPGSLQVTLRYTPTITVRQDYRFNIFGIGGMVGLNSLLFDNALPLDVSLQAGIMSLNAHASLDVKPVESERVENSYPASQWEGQELEFKAQSFVVNLLGGKKISILALYGGVGYQFASTDIETIGSYPVVVAVSDESDSENAPTHEIQSLDDPINFTLAGSNTIHLLGGLQIKIGFISISAAYTLAEYPTLRASLGFTFGS